MSILSRLRRMCKVKRYNVSCLSDPANIIDVSAQIPITIERVTLDNVGNVTDFQPEAFTSLFKATLQDNQCGVYAVDDSKTCGHAWSLVCREASGRSVGYYRLRAGEAFVHYCEVDPSHRGRDIYPAMLCCLCRRLFDEEGVSKVIVNTEIGNSAALRSIAKVGFQTEGLHLFVLFRGKLVFKRDLSS
jgi:RimJ/RimL family protein N-acetyltransferase